MPAFIDGEWQDGEVRGVNFLAGIRGMGKTTELGRLMNTCSGTVVFYDHTGNHEGLLRRSVTVKQPGELKDALLRRRGREFIRYVPPPDEDEFGEEKANKEAPNVTHFRAVCAVCNIFGRLILAVDEMDNYCGQEWGAKQMPRELYRLIHFGRHPKISMLFTARDPTTISIKARSQCETVRVFRTIEESYVRYFQPRIGKEMASRLMTLPHYQYVFSSSSIPLPAICKAGKLISE